MSTALRAPTSKPTRQLDVVVPAHDEQALIGGCLRAVLCDAGTIDLRIIVVANGCTDGTAQLVRTIAADVAADVAAKATAGLGSSGRAEIVLVELPAAGKAAALNAADRHRRGAPVLYLDADTVITPGTLPALVHALDKTPSARLVAPRPVLVRPTDRLGRDFATVWLTLPAVSGQVVGAGCYAVNPAGRARWTEFPELTADDAYVRSRFAPAEQQVLGSGGFLLVLPRWWELIAVASRWRRGNAELDALTGRQDPKQAGHQDPEQAGHQDPEQAGNPSTRTDSASPAAGAGRNLAVVAARPALWPHLPGFLLVNGAGRLLPRQRWPRAAGLRALAQDARASSASAQDAGASSASAQDQPPSGRPGTVDVLVIRRPRVNHERCLDNLRSDWARLRIAVVDADAAAVDRVAGRGTGSHLLLVDGNVELTPGALDELLALATRFPTAGLYVGSPVGRRPVPARVGPVDRRPLSDRTAPVDRPGRRHRYEVLPTRTLPTGLLLVERMWWHRLSGLGGHHHAAERTLGDLPRFYRRARGLFPEARGLFPEARGLFPEARGFFQRARRSGATPIRTNSATYQRLPRPGRT